MLNTTCPYLQEWKATVRVAFITITFECCTQIQVHVNEENLSIRGGLISSHFSLISVELILVHLRVNWIKVKVNNSAFSLFRTLHRCVSDDKNESLS